MSITCRGTASAGNASGGNLTINKPTGTVNGEYMEVTLYSEYSSTAWSLPTGWAWRGGSTGQALRGSVGWVFTAYKIASSEGTSYTFTHGGTAWRTGVIATFSPTAGSSFAADPEDSTGPTGKSSALAEHDPIAASITTSTNNDMAIIASGNYTGSNLGAGSSGYTLAGQLGGTGILYKIIATAGATGAITVDNATNDDQWATWHEAIKETAGGTTYNQSVSGAVTSSGGLSRLTATSKAGTVTSAGAIAKRDATAKTGAVTPSGGVLKKTATAKTGTLTSAGTLIKRAGKALIGAVVSAGTLLRQIATGKSGTLTSTGILTKQIATAKTGALTSSGALAAIRTVLLALTGALTSAGALTRQTGKTLTGTVASAGSVLKRTARAFTGDLSSSGALTSIKAFFVALTGDLTSAGALIKRMNTPKAGTITSSGTLSKQTTKTLIGTLTSSGALSTLRIILKSLVGTLSSDGTLNKHTARALAGAMPSAGVVTKQIARALGGVLSWLGDLIADALGQLRGLRALHLRERSFSLTLSDRAIALNPRAGSRFSLTLEEIQ